MLREVSNERRPPSLVMDEFQRVYEVDPGLAGMFKDLTDELPRVSLVFAGSKRHLMDEMTTDSQSAALFWVGRKLYLEKISLEAFVPFMVARAAGGGKHLDRTVAEMIYQVARGIPNDVQLLAFWSYEAASKVIDTDAVDRAIADAIGDQGVEFAWLFDSMSPSQQRLLRLIARGGVRRLATREVMTALEVSSPNAGDPRPPGPRTRGAD